MPPARSPASLIVVTRVADIIVTLAMLFVWAGVALRGAAGSRRRRAAQYQNLVTVDTVVAEWLPAALVILVVVVRAGLAADPADATRPRALRDRLEPRTPRT